MGEIFLVLAADESLRAYAQMGWELRYLSPYFPLSTCVERGSP